MLRSDVDFLDVVNLVLPAIFKGPEEAEEPEEMVNSRAEIQEENMLKVTAGFDQMHIEDDVEGIEEEEYIILEEVQDVQIIEEVPDVQDELESRKFSLKLRHFSLQNKITETKIYMSILALKKCISLFENLLMFKNRCEMGGWTV